MPIFFNNTLESEEKISRCLSTNQPWISRDISDHVIYCARSYTRENYKSDPTGRLGYIIYRVQQAVKALFKLSDWQKSVKLLCTKIEKLNESGTYPEITLLISQKIANEILKETTKLVAKKSDSGSIPELSPLLFEKRKEFMTQLLSDNFEKNYTKFAEADPYFQKSFLFSIEDKMRIKLLEIPLMAQKFMQNFDDEKQYEFFDQSISLRASYLPTANHNIQRRILLKYMSESSFISKAIFNDKNFMCQYLEKLKNINNPKKPYASYITQAPEKIQKEVIQELGDPNLLAASPLKNNETFVMEIIKNKGNEKLLSGAKEGIQEKIVKNNPKMLPYVSKDLQLFYFKQNPELFKSQLPLLKEETQIKLFKENKGIRKEYMDEKISPAVKKAVKESLKKTSKK